MTGWKENYVLYPCLTDYFSQVTQITDKVSVTEDLWKFEIGYYNAEVCVDRHEFRCFRISFRIRDEQGQR